MDRKSAAATEATVEPPGRLLSTVITKCFMALSGLAFAGFVLVHLAGNFLLFRGPEKYNAYSKFLEDNPLTIPAEIGLVAIFLLHIFLSLKLTLENWLARPVAYGERRTAGQSTFASRTMIYTGALVWGFVILHVWMFKYGVKYTPDGKLALWELVATSFQKPWVCAVYVAALAVLGFHLSHALTSALQSLGWLNYRWRARLRLPGMVAGWAVAAAFATMPLWMYMARQHAEGPRGMEAGPRHETELRVADVSSGVAPARNQKPETRN